MGADEELVSLGGRCVAPNRLRRQGIGGEDAGGYCTLTASTVLYAATVRRNRSYPDARHERLECGEQILGVVEARMVIRMLVPRPRPRPTAP